jgi:hypothetical protein
MISIKILNDLYQFLEIGYNKPDPTLMLKKEFFLRKKKPNIHLATVKEQTSSSNQNF